MNYQSIPIRQYHDLPHLGSSTLKAMELEGPEYAMAKLAMPEHEDSRALVFGSAVHAMIDGSFAKSFVVAQDAFKTATSDKFAEWCAQQPDNVECITAREYQDAKASAESIRRKIGSTIAGRRVIREPSILWTQETATSHIDCKCRPDLLVEVGSGEWLYLEIKTAADIGYWAWRNAMRRYCYWLQQAHYEAGILAAGAKSVRTLFVAVRKSSPNDVRIYELSDDDKASAAARWSTLIDEYAVRCASGDWETDSVERPTPVSLGLQFGEQLEGFEGG